MIQTFCHLSDIFHSESIKSTNIYTHSFIVNLLYYAEDTNIQKEYFSSLKLFSQVTIGLYISKLTLCILQLTLLMSLRR